MKYKNRDGLKPIGTMLFGSSPEFELALYTVTLLASKSGTAKVSINGCRVNIMCMRKGRYVATCYPS